MTTKTNRYEMPEGLGEKYSEDDKAILAKIYAWLNTDGSHSKADLAKRAGMAEGTLATVLSGSYNASPSSQLLDILKATERATARALSRSDKPVIISTKVMQDATSMFKRSQLHHSFTLVAGLAGIGKTVAAKAFADANPDVIYISALDDMKKSTLLTDLVETVGANPRRWGTDAMLSALIKTLKGRDCTILIDEAENMTDGCFESLRQLHDHAGIGFCLIGEAALFQRIKRNQKFNKLESRLMANTGVVQGITRAEADAIVKGHFGETDEDTLAAFWKHSQGSTRRLVNGLIGEIKQSNWLERIDAKTKNKIELGAPLVRAVSKQLLKD